MPVIIGSRKSHLAQAQAKKVNAVLNNQNPDLETELYFRPSFGDLNLDMDLSKTNQKGVFTQDFLELLESGGCDMVVHSWKDLPIEDSGTTKIVSTLEREDSRDVFLLKKNAFKKKTWNVLTSSPRREFNLSSLFGYLSDGEQVLTFSPIRGNIPTRFEKFINDDSADGFCVALAAVKRLKSFKDFNEANPGIWEKLDELCTWSVLPESYCPSAAAQGALAIEVLRTNKRVIQAVESISHDDVFDAVVKERQILKSYGGGCHLAVGASVLPHEKGELTFIAGNVNGESFRSVEFKSNKAYPQKVERSKIWISSEQVVSVRKPADSLEVSSTKKVFVISKSDKVSTFLKKRKSLDVIFTSGLKTWKKLFKEGIWIHGCLDNLGVEQLESDVLSSDFQKTWVTRAGVEGPEGFETLHIYSLESSVDPASFENKDYFIWMSGELLKNSLKNYPELKTKTHFIGLGRSSQILTSAELEGVEVNHFYTLEQLLNDLSSN